MNGWYRLCIHSFCHYKISPLYDEHNVKKNSGIFFRRGYPSLFFSFLGDIYFWKPSKMTFWPKKLHGSLQKCLKNDLNLPNIKFGGKKLKKNWKNKLIFFSNSHFLGYENDTPKSKNWKKGLVQDLKIALRWNPEKIRHFEFWEPKNRCYTSTLFILFD